MSAGDPTATTSDPFHLGWRFVRETGPDGVEISRQVPLTERDLLFPQEEDFVVQRDPHIRDMLYLREAFRVVLRQRETVHVFADHRIDFNLHGVEPLGPDVAIVDGIADWDGSRGTLRIAEQGRPLLVVEITSPDTRKNDFGIKRHLYERAGVPVYVVIDRQAGESRDEVALCVLRLNGEGYHQLTPDAQGRVHLPQLGIAVGIEDEQAWLYQRSGERIEEMPRLYDMIEAFQRQLEEADLQREHLVTQMELEIGLRRSESAARREAEGRAAEAEGRASQAEGRASEAALRLQRESLARQQAEEKAAALERRLSELEEQARGS